MKIVYSQLQKLLPSLKGLNPKQIADRLTSLGHFNDSLTKIKNDTIIGLEIRQNRGDCLSYYGIAQELSPLFGPLNLPEVKTIPSISKTPLDISVNSPNNVYRLQAIRLSGLKNKSSSSLPQIKKILLAHDIHPVNAIVDITNYIMLFWGIPCHAFDTKKSSLSLIWEQNRGKYTNFTTLDGTKLKLGPETLMVNSPQKALSLSFLGGQSSAIQKDSNDIIIEMAVYNPTRVRQDSRFLKTSTEAGIRLDKFLDPELIPPAFSSLVYLILKHCGGQISSQLFNYYPQIAKTPKILFHPPQVSSFAGINIPSSFCLTILKKIGCLVEKNKKNYLITPPSLRPDISLEEDLIEEIIRYFGYEKIPTDQVFSSKKTANITPPLVSLICTLQNILTSFGYDEIRSWPLVNQKMIVNPKTVIYTQNSINSKYPALRQSIIPSLVNQKKQYSRFKLENQQFFEIGKIYYQEREGDYQERYSLAFHHPDPAQLQKDLNKLLAHLNLNQDLLMDPILLSQQKNDSYVEIILDNLVHHINPQDLCLDFSTKKYTAYELEQQIITLDANLNFKSKKDPKKLLEKYVKILKDKLWQIKITDIYFDQKTKKYRYTLQVSYLALNDKSAKKLHLKTFNLR